MVQELRRPKPEPETGWKKAGAGTEEMAGVSQHGVDFQNSWQNAAGWAPVSWYIDSEGEVKVRGHVTGGAVGTVIFTFPEEARPEYAETYIVPTDSGGRATIRVDTNGNVTLLNMFQ